MAKTKCPTCGNDVANNGDGHKKVCRNNGEPVRVSRPMTGGRRGSSDTKRRPMHRGTFTGGAFSK